MDREKLNKILQNHRKWLDDPDRWGEVYRAKLRGVNLIGENLRGADLRGAKLCGASLLSADLRGADLRSADLRGASLLSADLRGADLRYAKLTHANLTRANLEQANLEGTSLQCVNLKGADARGADFRGADLKYTDTHEMKVNTETKIDWPMACPETGSFIAWKKAGSYIVKLEIPEDAKRSSATTNKCRASKAMVMEIQNRDGTKAYVPEANSMRGWIYKAGEMVYPDEWDDNRWNECSHGIHFFMTREEAVEW